MHQGRAPTRQRRYTAAVLGAVIALAGCGPAPHKDASTTGQRCATHALSGSRLPGFLNPAFPQSGLFPAPGGFPPAGTSGLVLKVRTKALVVTYGQALERAATNAHDRLVSGQTDGTWGTIPLAAGYTFQLFGPPVPLFGVIPAPLITGSRAAGLKYAWVITQWDAVQAITILRGTEALAQSAAGWKQIPPGVSPANLLRAADQVKTAEAAGWTLSGVYKAGPACGAPADHLGPFGARAFIRLPLGVPLQLVAPGYGGMVLRVVPG